MTDPDRPDHEPSPAPPVDLGKKVQRPWGTPLDEQPPAEAPEQQAPPTPDPAATPYSPAYGGTPHGSGTTAPYAGPHGPAYGGQPGGYGGGYAGPYAPPQAPRSTDGVSITAFVLSLTCCLSLVGAILGFVGLSRTKDGRRGGRWAAITAIVLGVLGTVVTAGAIVFGVTTFAGSTFVGDMEAGECADRVLDDRSDFPVLRPVGCDGDHDGEVLGVGTYDDLELLLGTYGGGDVESASADELAQACADLSGLRPGPALGAGVASGDLDITVLSEDGEPSGFDPVACFVESSDGDPLDAPVLD